MKTGYYEESLPNMRSGVYIFTFYANDQKYSQKIEM